MVLSDMHRIDAQKIVVARPADTPDRRFLQRTVHTSTRYFWEIKHNLFTPSIDMLPEMEILGM